MIKNITDKNNNKKWENSIFKIFDEIIECLNINTTPELLKEGNNFTSFRLEFKNKNNKVIELKAYTEGITDNYFGNIIIKDYNKSYSRLFPDYGEIRFKLKQTNWNEWKIMVVEYLKSDKSSYVLPIAKIKEEYPFEKIKLLEIIDRI